MTCRFVFPAGRVLGLHLQLCGGRASLRSTQSGRLPAQPLLGIHHPGQAHLHPCVLPNEAGNYGLHQCGKAVSIGFFFRLPPRCCLVLGSMCRTGRSAPGLSLHRCLCVFAADPGARGSQDLQLDALLF